MDYIKIYNNLINKAKERNNLDIFEIHHIIPKCIGGNDNKQNLVKLTPKEHFIAHKLLCKIYSYKGIRYAFCMMVNTSMNFVKNKQNCTTNRYYHISSKDYEECKLFLKQDTSKRFKGKIYVNNKEIQLIISPDELENYLNNGWYKGKLPFSEETLKSIKLKAKSRILSEETYIKKSNSMSGEKNPSYNTKIMNKNGKNIRVKLDQIKKYLNDGWELGMIKKNYQNRNENLNNIKNNKATIKNKKYVHTETKPYLIRYSNLEDYEYYINILKWLPGSGTHRKECKENNFLLKKIFMFNKENKISKKIPIELKDLYLSRGWIIGKGNYYKKGNA